MGKKFAAMISIFCVLLMTVILVNPVVSKWVEEEQDTRVDIIPGPYRDLAGLVTDLIAATSDMTDTDGDNIPDTVELVIGTDPEHEDTDRDTINDDVEISLNTDPHKIDSNGDGLPDSLEMIGVPIDPDGDGVSNAWDSDNDGDGLEDATDLSPFARSSIQSSFHLDLNTTGKPVYISFQIRPQDPAHMNMMIGSYNWPYDDKAMMKDLDNSEEDLFINPIMKIKMNDVPDQEDVIDYGIVVDGDTCIVPMFPERQYGEIVALRGKMFIPAGEPTDLDLDLSLDWSVTANTDQKVSSIKTSNGKYITAENTGKVYANATVVSDHQGLVIEELGGGQKAFRATNGNYLGTDGSGFLTAGWARLDDNCKFTIATVSDVDYIKTSVNSYLVLQIDGSIKTSILPIGANVKFNISDAGIKTQMINLITYPESFAIVGLEASEKFGTEVGVFYGDDLEELLMSSVVISRDFLRNNTNNMGDVTTFLTAQNLTLSSLTGSYDHTDLAMIDCINRLLDTAVSSLPDGSTLPVLTLVEDTTSKLDLMELTITGSNSFMIDLGNEPAIRARMMKSTWYNAPSTEPLQPGQLIEEISSWGLNRNIGTDSASLLLFWATGDSTVMSVGDNVTVWNIPEVSLDIYSIGMTIFSTAKWMVGAPLVIIGGFKLILEIGAKVDILTKAGAAIGKGLNSIIKALKIVKIVDTAKDVLKFLDTIGPILDMVGLIIDFGIGVFNLIMIVCSNGWDAFAASVATAQFMIQMAYSIVMFLIGLIPVVGTIIGIIMLIADLVDLILTWIPGVSGYNDIIMNWILGLVAGARTFCDLDLEIVSTEMEMIDRTGNGIDAGDRFEINSIVNTSVVKTRWGGKEDVEEGFIKPSYIIYTPSRPDLAGNTGTRYSSRGRHSDVITETKNDQRKDTQWDVGAYVEPGFGMVNYPVSSIFKTEYKIFYEEYNYVAFWFPGLWERKNISDSDYSNLETMYFDIMPENMDDLAKWGFLTRSDPDGDTLNASEEIGTSPWRWDSDGDGLGDAYEFDMGYNPSDPDTDLDGINDRLEEKKGMDLNNDDTDGDGLLDYLELEGWVVNFVYDGTPFYWHIVSDPTLNDTDGDGINDLYEFYCNLNPLSPDTNGDWTIDELTDYTTIDVIQKNIIGDDESRPFYECNEIAVDRDGNFYILGYQEHSILKISSSGSYQWVKKLTQWPDNYADQIKSVFVGPNGTIYAGSWGWTGDIMVYLLDTNGNVKTTWTNSHIGTISTMWVDRDDNLYACGIGPGEFPWMVKFDPNGTELASVQLPYGSGTGGILPRDTNSIAVNSHGDIYLIDYANSRVHVYYPNLVRNFTWQISQFEKPGDLYIDRSDNIYICDEDQTYGRIQVFDINRRLLSEWTSTLTETCIYVGNDGTIYVGGNTASGTYRGRIISFDMKTTLHRVSEDLVAEDTDEDGLSDEMEWAGWLCNYTEPAGYSSERVYSSAKIFDTDSDGLNDSYEMELGTNPNSTDTDMDGLDDMLELDMGTDPLHFDSDLDGLLDSLEFARGSDPMNNDTDGEGLNDLWEFDLGTDPNDPDTDDDGLSDYDEWLLGYDPLNPDKDGDSLFDSDELDMGCDPAIGDHDNDGIMDGMEILYETDPSNGDSDGDLLLDGFEIDMKLNPNNNDTDGDGMIDSRELEIGYNPFSRDSDGDGIPDGSDLDFTIEIGNITMITDDSQSSDDLKTNLMKHSSVSSFSPSELNDTVFDDEYIVIVGAPTQEANTSGRLIWDLLSDAPELLEAMNSSLENRCVVRYGVWSQNQTIILLSKALKNDHNRVLGILRSVKMSIEGGKVISDYMTPVGFINLDSMDITRSVDAALFCELEGNATAVVEISSLAEPPVPMDGSSGIGLDVFSLDRFLQVEMNSSTNITRAELRVYYSSEDLDHNCNGVIDDQGDINETTLILYRLEAGQWIPVSSPSDVNMTDLTLNGIDYAGYIGVELYQFSIFGMAGNTIEIGEYKLRIGPVLDEEGDPVEDVDVVIDIGGDQFSAITDQDGEALITLSRAYFDREVDISITKDGYIDLFYNTRIDADGLLEALPPTFVKVPEVLEIFFGLPVGPILSDNGTALEGCTLVIVIGDLTLEGTTDENGYAYFNLSETLLGIGVTINISLEGFITMEYATSITMDGVLADTPPELEKIVVTIEEEEKEDDNSLIVLLALFLIVFSILMLFIFARRKEDYYEEE